jgi:hypothetical protein
MPRLLVAVPLLLLFTLVATPPAAAAPPVDPEQKEVVAVNKAIDNGIVYLKRNYDKETHWESFVITSLTSMKGGITALATLSLLNCGVRADDEVVGKALDYLRKLDPQKTYVVALCNLCLAEVREPKDQARIKANTDWLLKTAVRKNGKITGWSYPDPGIERVDASNTQYALLGLYAAKQAGVKIDDAEWKQILALYKDTQISESKDTGSWSYIEVDKSGSFTMTTAGVCGLLIARMGLDDSGQGLDPATGVAKDCGVYPENEAVRKGMNWLGNKFRFDGAEAAKSTYYNVYGIERVGRLSGQRFIGKADWYREGCKFLVDGQRADGSWASGESEGGSEQGSLRGVNVISTSFALLFLSKGRSPVLISKMAHGPFKMEGQEGKMLVEQESKGGVIDWNRKHNDARNLTDFCSRELFKNLPLGWQTYDPRRRDFATDAEILAEAGVLVQSPILYITGHNAPKLSGQQKQLLKKYLEEGGFVIAEACCGSKEFADEFRALLGEKTMFPSAALRPVPENHAIWKSHFLVPPTEFPKLECLDVGCRTVLVLSPEPLAGYWEEGRFVPQAGKEAASRGERAFHLGANIVAYATGKEPPKQRLSTQKLVKTGDEPVPPKGFVQPVQLKIGEEPPAKSAMRNLMGFLRENARLDVSLNTKELPPGSDDLFKFKFLYMHGKKAFDLDAKDVENVRDNLEGGGLLLADACCGSKPFRDSFQGFAKKLFPDRELELIPADDVLYSEKLNGKKIDLVERREKVASAKDGNDAGFERLPPALKGIKIDGRWAVIFSEYDIGCALENHKSTDCLGHTPDSARKLAAAAVLYSLKR